MKVLNLTILSIIAIFTLSCSTQKNNSSTAKKDYSRTSLDGKGDSGKNSDQGTTIVGINDIALQLGGEWNIISVGNKKVNPEPRAYLHFDFKNKRLYGNNGCNFINGTFTADAAL